MAGLARGDHRLGRFRSSSCSSPSRRIARAGMACTALLLYRCGWLMHAAFALPSRNLVAGGEALSIQGSQQHAEELAAPSRPAVAADIESLKRRHLFHLAAGLPFLVSSEARAQAPASMEQIRLALKAVTQVQAEWEELAKRGADGANAVSDRLSGTLKEELTIKIPADAQAVGIDIEGKTITRVRRSGAGWKAGDFVREVNGEEGDVATLVNKFRQAGKSLTFSVVRTSTSPFVTLQTALLDVYGSVPPSVVLPEPEEVQSKLQSVKFFCSIVQDGQGSLDVARPSVDSLAANLEIYAQAPEAAKQAGAVAAQANEAAQSEDFVPLF